MKKIWLLILIVLPILRLPDPPTFNQKIVKGPLPWPGIDQAGKK